MGVSHILQDIDLAHSNYLIGGYRLVVNLVKGLPEGWNEVNGIVRSQELDAGRLSLLL